MPGNIAKYYIFWWKFSFTIICIWIFRLEHVVKKDIDMNELLWELRNVNNFDGPVISIFGGWKKEKYRTQDILHVFPFFSFVQIQNGNLASKILINQSQLHSFCLWNMLHASHQWLSRRLLIWSLTSTNVISYAVRNNHNIRAPIQPFFSFNIVSEVITNVEFPH